MAYEIRKYNDHTWMIEDQLGVNSLTRFFLLAGEEREYEKRKGDRGRDPERGRAL